MDPFSVPKQISLLNRIHEQHHHQNPSFVVVVVVDDDDIVIDDDVLLKSIIKVMVPEVVDFLLLCGFLLRLCVLCFSFLEEPN